MIRSREDRSPRWAPQPAASFSIALVLGLALSPIASAAEDLSFEESQALFLAADRLDKLAVLDPTGEDPVGMYLVLGERFGLVHVYHLTYRQSEEIWKSKQLDGVVAEVRAGDLDGDGWNEVFLASTSSGMIYVWDAATFVLLFESLPTDYEEVHCFTLGNVDDDEATELIINADQKIHYVDGITFNREWTSLHEYQATRILCGDVDGDRTNELVLTTGQVVDSRSGDIEWEEEVFGSRIELMDMDGDGIPEVLTESDGTVLKVYDIDHGKEKRL